MADAFSITAPASRTYFGIAGWSYPDWDGIVYPRGVRERLKYIAGYVDLVEINTTFYRPPSARNSAAWLKQTGEYATFAFSAKLHQDITHGGGVEPDMIRQFHDGFLPLIESAKLRHLLAQFRYDYDDTSAHRARLECIRKSFGAMANIVFELRHRSWQENAALRFLESLGVTVANLDYPLASNSFSMRVCAVGADRYLRLHGRNRHAWFSKTAGRDETYNYYYSPPELADIAGRARSLAEGARSMTIVANNHYQGKEVANIIKLKAMLQGGKLPVPPGLQAKYPELNEIAAP